MMNQEDLKCISIIKEKLINADVVDIKIGYSTMIIVANESNKYYYTISFGNSEIFIEGKSNWIKSGDIESKLCLANLFKNKITSFDIDDDGNLSIEFDQNLRKVVTKSNDNYEAWEINGPENFKIVCSLGGGIVCWYDE